MGYFNNYLAGDESLFKNEEALDLEFVPKLLPFREDQQRAIAQCINPLLAGRNGKNVLVYGDPGIGKTSATRWILRDLEETTDDVEALYVNCWQKNTSYKLLVELCQLLGYRFTQNKNTEEIFAVIKNILNKKTAVFVFDEIDKIEDFDFLYSILNDIYKKSVILITNYKEWITNLEPRVRSRLMPDMLYFPAYNQHEVEEILKQRSDAAFVPGVWSDELIKMIAAKSYALKDVRAGIFMLRECALLAENSGSKKIDLSHVEAIVRKVDEQGINKEEDLDEDSRMILDMVKEKSPGKIGDIFDHYKKGGGGSTYKTFQRKVVRLEKAKLISTNKIIGGKEGSTTIVSYGKKLTDF